MGVRIVFFDCDGTLTKVKSSWEYLHRRLGLWDKKADEYQELFRRGRIDYHEFCRRDALLWKGLSLGRVRDIVDEIPYHDGARLVTEFLSAKGIPTVILSTGLSLLVERVRSELGMTHGYANDLLHDGSALTGEIRINVEHDDKGYWVRRILAESGFCREDAAAIGDGSGDRGMFEEVGTAIGYHPSPDLTGLLTHTIACDSLAPLVDILGERLDGGASWGMKGNVNGC